MPKPLVASIALLTLCPLAAPVYAGSSVTVNKAHGWETSSVQRVAVVVTECSGSVNCDVVQGSVAAAAARLWKTVPRQKVAEGLFQLGEAEYSEEMRQPLIEALSTEERPVDAILEVSVPHAKHGGGPFTDRRSEAVLKVVLRRKDGTVLMVGTGRGRPLNVVSGPERVLRKLGEDIFRKAFP